MTTPTAGPGPRWLAAAGQVALAAGMAALLLPVGWASVFDGDVSGGWVVALLTALVVVHAAVATAGRHPVASYAAGAVAMFVLVVGPDLGGTAAEQAGSEYAPVLLPSSLCFFVLLYGVSARAPRPWPTAALGVGLIGCLVTTTRLWSFAGVVLEGWAWSLILGTATVGGTVAAWALGRFRATRTAWIAQLEERGAADERRRIAREMHDVVAHSLAVVVSQAEGGRMVVGQSPERAGEILGTIADTGREALTEMRGLLGVLRDEDATAGPQPGLADLPALVARMRQAGLEIAYEAEPVGVVPPGVGLTAYRVVQESLTNVARHAPGRAATVVVRRTADGLEVAVEDDAGTGVPATPPGRGITGMSERVEAVGGRLEAGPGAPGWTVRARIPL